MITRTSMNTLRRLTLLATGAAGLALAAPAAQAQAAYGYNGYDQYGRDAAYESGSDDLVVQAPRHHRQYSTIGAPIEDVAISRRVSYRDLDLRTGWGARELRARVRQAAESACNELDTMYPIATDDSPPCRATAIRDGMREASAAIRYERGYASNNW